MRVRARSARDSRPAVGGFQDGRCIETTLADASGVITINSAFGRVGSGPINESSEYLIAVVRGAPLGGDRGFVAERLDGYGKISVPARAESRANPWGDVVWRVPLFKPAGGGLLEGPAGRRVRMPTGSSFGSRVNSR